MSVRMTRGSPGLRSGQDHTNPLPPTRKSKPSLVISSTWGKAFARRRTSSASATEGRPAPELLDCQRRWCRAVVVCRVELRARRHDLVDAVENVVAQYDVRAGQQILKLLGGSGPDEHRRDRRVRSHERDGEVGQWHPRLGRYLRELLNGG